MKTKTKKALIISAAIAVPTVVIGTASAVYFTSTNVERISKKGIYILRVNETLNNEGYKYDLSANYGSPTAANRTTTLINNEILRLKTSGKLEYKDGKVIKPCYESYKFANADSIVLTFVKADLTTDQIKTEFDKETPDETKVFQLIFNSDDDSFEPTDPTQEQFVLTRDSNEPRSINNSKIFGEIIKHGYLDSKPNLDDTSVSVNTSIKNYVLASMGVTFDSGAKWVDSNGNKTKYDICAEDMFYSGVRTWLYDKNYRQTHGGSEKLDQYFIKKTQTLKMFGEKQKYPNEYLFDFFGVDKRRLYKEDQAISKVIGKTNVNGKTSKAFNFTFNVFNKDKTINTDFSYYAKDIIKKYLSNSIHYSLAPSQYIKELAKNESLNSTSVGKITKEARTYGIYTYAQDRENTLFASEYVPVYSQAGREIFEYNKYFANQEWVKEVEQGVKEKDGSISKILNKVIIEYANGIDSSTFINQSFTAFMNGTLSQVDYSQLSASQKQTLYGSSSTDEQLIQNAANNGLNVTKKVNVSTMTSRMVWQANPAPQKPEDKGNYSGYLFNDTYSKLVYGSSTNDLLVGNAKTANSFYGLDGLKFRLLIQASINWQQYIQTAYSGTRDVWLSGAAQNARFSSVNDKSLSPFEFNRKGVNDLMYFDKDGAIKTVSLNDMIWLSNATKEEIEKKYGVTSIDNLNVTKLQSPHFKVIKESMKKLLDDWYKENNISSNQKIEWNIAYPFADQNAIKCDATQQIVDSVINQLDPRINAKFIKPTTRDQMLSEINQRKGAYNANLWSYDYEGIGSYFAAFTSDGGGINIVNAIGIFSKDTTTDDNKLFEDGRLSKSEVENLQKAFPEFTKLAKFIRKEMNMYLELNNAKPDSKLYVENWDVITNKENNNINDYFGIESHNRRETSKINPNQISPVSALPTIYKLYEEEAEWEKDASLSEEQKGQHWTNLIKEMNAIKGVSIDTESSVDKLDNVNYTLFLKEYIVPISKYGIQQYSDIKYKP